jgi:hypothetical protein
MNPNPLQRQLAQSSTAVFESLHESNGEGTEIT